ncbi:hypothetical protein B296_00047212 [Ensete ventricosum]|uniref:Uncharacterized protein n=1 Tax=Ensete ventricosum TaxID=4639 RepID=A0A426Y4A1_ENSVE|nr:hypothetical protein B296_00047212 [Ensete ventricosum]
MTISVLVCGSSSIVTGRVVIPRVGPPTMTSDRLYWAWSLIPFWTLVRVVSLFSNVMAEVPLTDYVLNLVFEVSAFFSVMVVFQMETILSSLIPLFGVILDHIRGRQESLPRYLEEDLRSG